MANITGTSGNDTLNGTTDADFINGLAGADTMLGGLGSDTYVVDNAGDVANETGGDGTDTVQSGITFSLSDAVHAIGDIENLTLTGAAALNGTGNALGNVITGNTGANILAGLGGADTLIGNGGIDTASYAASAAGVTVSLVTGLGSGGDAEGDTLATIENLTGSNQDDTLEGNAANNVLAGGTNGVGGDTVSYANAGAAVTVSLAVVAAQNTVGAGTDTLTGFENLTGSAFNDTLTGSTGNNVLRGLAGNDTLNGGAGADTMIGGLGSDTYVVDNAGDVADETDGDGTDTVQSSITFSLSDAVHAIGDIENLTLTGATAINATGNDLGNVLTGNTGINTLTGLGGNDTLDGLAGADTMLGGLGSDTYVVDNAGDVANETGGDGTDTVQSGITFSLSDAVHAIGDIENLTLTGAAALNGTGNALGNVITGNTGANILAGLGGADTLIGNGGIDTASYAASAAGVTVSLVTGLGSGGDAEGDTLATIENLTGSNQDDTLEGNAANNVLAGGTNGVGGDTVSYANAGAAVTVSLAVVAAQNTVGAGTDTLTGFENLTGSAFNDTLTGSTGNNVLRGLAGNDTLNGGAGADTMIGGLGSDTYVVDNAGDVADETDGDGTDTVQSSITFSLSDAVHAIGDIENLTLTGATAINATGNDLGNVLTGNTGINTLTGLGGNDTLDGLAGADTMLGGLGSDTYVVDNAGDVANETGGDGTDTVQSGITFSLSDAVHAIGDIENLTLTGAAALNGTGNALGNVITGNTGANILAGLGGADTLIGNGGIDTASYAASAAGVTVSLVTGLGSGGDAEGDTLATIENLTGSNQDDTLEGNAANNVLAGGTNGVGGDTVSYANAGAAVTVSLAVVAAQNTVGAGTDTLTGFENLTGSAFNDTLTGSTGNNVLRGLAGNDTLNGGAGADTMIGGLGSDTYVVDNAGDVADETDGDGTDTVQSSITFSLSDAVHAIGDIENLTLTGATAINATGNDLGNVLTGNTGINTLTGLGGNDTLDGLAGADTMLGGLGSDTYVVDNAGDVANETGGDGTDTVQSGITFSLSDAVHAIGDIENLTLTGAAALNGTGNALGNVITGNTGANILAGLGGADTLIGNGGIDTASYAASAAGVTVSLVTGLGSGGDAEGDTLATIENLTGSNQDDTLEGNAANNVLAGGTNGVGGDTVSYANAGAAVTVSLAVVAAQNTVGAGTDTLTGFENLTGSAFNDTLTGSTGNNVLRGLAGNDTLNGGAGADTMIGGLGSDTYVVDNAGDVADETDGDGTDTVQSSITFSLSDAVHAIGDIENLTLTGATAINATGNDLGNVLTGNTGINTLTGLGGNDTLDGLAGADTMLGGLGSDTYVVDNAGDVANETGGDGTDTVQSGITFSLSDAVHAIGDIENLTLTGAAALNGTGNALGNVITGNTGANILAGLGGADTLIGNGGIDTASYAASAAGVTVSLVTGLGSGGDAEGDTLATIENLTGSNQDDTLEGNAANNVLAGGTNGVGGDTVSYANAGAAVTVSLAVVAAQNTVGAGTDTLTGFENLTGSAFNDTLTGSTGNNVLRGLAGNDTLNGGAGADTMIGGLGSDTYVVDNAGDVADETDGDGTDTVQSSITFSLSDAVHAIGDIENLTLTGATAINATGNDLGNVLTGNTGINTLTGLGGNDTLDGLAGADTMLGGLGSDTYVVDNAGDVANETGGDGTDTVQSGITFSLSDAVHAIGDIENLTLTGAAALNGTGNALGNVITGNTGANILAGLGGADTLIGNGGIDTASYAASAAGVTVSLVTGLGSGGDAEGDTLATIENLTGSNQDDTLEGNAANNVLAGGTNGVGGDTVSYANAGAAVTVSLAVVAAQNTVGAGTDTLTGFENLTGSAFNDTLTGSTGNNVLRGLAGNDTLNGGAGADTMIGGLGSDTYVVDNAGDVADETDGDGTDTVQSSITFSLSDAVHAIGDIENLTLTGATAINATGNDLGNVLTGNTGINTLNGGAGADTMIGLAGNDTYVVDNVGDIVDETGGNGIDTIRSSITFNLSDTVHVKGTVENLTLIGTDAVDGTGNALANVIVGNTANNTLNGGVGNDTLTGGGGSDKFFFTNQGAVNPGNDQITDFVLGTDSIELGGTLAYSANPISTSGGNTIITLSSGNTITLVGVTGITSVSQLTGVMTGTSGDDSLVGTTGNDTLNGLGGNDTLTGAQGDDMLIGGTGADIYVWNPGDGYDTIVSTNAANEDIIQINGSFYDYNYEVAGDDLLVGVVTDDTYTWAGNLRIEDFFTGGDSIAYMEADLGPANEFYSPGGGNARIYFSAITGTNQGNYWEQIIGTSGDDIMTDSSGIGTNRFVGLDGDDTMSISNGISATFLGGNGADTMTGADLDDTFRGGAGADIMEGADGIDLVRYDRPSGSAAFTQGTFVNLSADDVTFTFNGTPSVTVLAHRAIDNWGDTDTLNNIEDVRGSNFDDVIVGTSGENGLEGLDGADILVGGMGDDFLNGGAGLDTYIWNAGDGYDTIGSNGAANEDVILINGTFYNYNYNMDGNDLIIGVAADENYDWMDVGGNLRIQDFFAGGDSIAYMEADLGADNNANYSPDGGNSRIYFNFLTGVDQGNNRELIFGTADDDVMTDVGGNGLNRFEGFDGNDTITASNGSQSVLVGGDGNDTMTGADQTDELGGGAGDDTMDGAGGIDIVTYYRAAENGSTNFTHGAFVNLSGASVTYDFNGVSDVTLLAGKAIDNWGDIDTLSNIEEVRGSNFDDVIIGNDGENYLVGRGGNDIIDGGAGDDFIFGGGDDTFVEDGSFDQLIGGSGADSFVFGSDIGVTIIEDFVVGTDLLRFKGSANISTLEEIDYDGDTFADSTYVNLSNGGAIYLIGVTGAVAADLVAPAIEGTPGDDTLNGTVYNDTIIGGQGNDTLAGGGGADTYVWNAGDGNDTVSSVGAANEDIVQINGTFYDYNWEVDGDDLLVGVVADDTYTWAGNLRIEDFFAGGDSIAYMEADLGPNDEYYSPGADNSRIYFSSMNGTDQGNNFEVILGTSGNDVMTDAAGSGENKFWGFDGDDTISVSNGVWGTLIGGNGNDTLTGADQNDTLRGAAGNDIMDGGDGVDLARYDRPSGSVNFTHGAFVNLSGSAATFDFNGIANVTVLAGKAIDNWGDTDTLSNIEEVRGSNFDDVIIGTSGDNFIDGLDGDDIIVGGGGFDYFKGGGGADSFVFGPEAGDTTIEDFVVGQDLLRFQGDVGIASFEEQDWGEAGLTTVITLTTGATVNLIGVAGLGSASELIVSAIEGTPGDDTLNGTVYNDTIIGGQGNDTLAGGGGADTYVWNAGDGNDTVSSVGAANEDIVQINGTFYDYNWEVDGDDLLVGVVADDTYTWAGNLRIEDFFAGGDSIAYMEADLGPNDEYYSPGADNSRIYFSSMNGTDQGNNFEVILGTSGNDVMTDAAGSGENKFWGFDGDDTISVSNGVWGTLIGGNGNDTLTGADQNDTLRGAAGNDIMDGGDGVDLARYDRPSGSVNFTHGAFVNLSGSAATFDFNGIANVTVLAGKAIDNWGDTDTLSNIEEVRGSNFDDVIIGTSGDNFIDGLDGDDIIVGGAGSDYMVGGAGSDTFIFGNSGGYRLIEDFVVGEDSFQFQDGVTIGTLAELDMNGDEITDTLVTFSTGANVSLLGVVGITDPNDLLA